MIHSRCTYIATIRSRRTYIATESTYGYGTCDECARVLLCGATGLARHADSTRPESERITCMSMCTHGCESTAGKRACLTSRRELGRVGTQPFAIVSSP